MHFPKRFFFCFMISVLLIPDAHAQVKGEQSVVAGRDINARDIIIKYGLPKPPALPEVR
jgi:hypothetical protein